MRDFDLDLQVLQTGDVIAFYNSVFVPAVKIDLLRINQDRASLSAPPAAEGLIGESPVRRYTRSASILLHTLSVSEGAVPAIVLDAQKDLSSCQGSTLSDADKRCIRDLAHLH